MKLARAYLAFLALVFLGLGVWFLLDPGAGKLVGLVPSEGTGRAELRAMYGGLDLGIGAFLAWGAARQSWARPALAFGALALLGLALGRAVGIALDQPDGVMVRLIASELVTGGLCVAALVATREGPELDASSS